MVACRYAYVGESLEDSEAMYEYKLSLCPNSNPHDWTHCRFAHEGEVARRCGSLSAHFKAIPMMFRLSVVDADSISLWT